jgi:hypothetical protein
MPIGVNAWRRSAISRRLGHGSPNVTLGVYAHLFETDDT